MVGSTSGVSVGVALNISPAMVAVVAGKAISGVDVDIDGALVEVNCIGTTSGLLNFIYILKTAKNISPKKIPIFIKRPTLESLRLSRCSGLVFLIFFILLLFL